MSDETAPAVEPEQTAPAVEPDPDPDDQPMTRREFKAWQEAQRIAAEKPTDPEPERAPAPTPEPEPEPKPAGKPKDDDGDQDDAPSAWFRSKRRKR